MLMLQKKEIKFISHTKNFQEKEYCFNEITKKCNKLTNEIIDTMNMKDLKVIIQYYS